MLAALRGAASLHRLLVQHLSDLWVVWIWQAPSLNPVGSKIRAAGEEKHTVRLPHAVPVWKPWKSWPRRGHQQRFGLNVQKKQAGFSRSKWVFFSQNSFLSVWALFIICFLPLLPSILPPLFSSLNEPNCSIYPHKTYDLCSSSFSSSRASPVKPRCSRVPQTGQRMSLTVLSRVEGTRCTFLGYSGVCTSQ